LESLFSPFGELTEGVSVSVLSILTPSAITHSLTHSLVIQFCFSFFAASLIIDPKTQRPKGFGFVSYQSEIQAQKAIKALNATVIVSFLYIYLLLLYCLSELEYCAINVFVKMPD
jgi:cold-inducible RNA-binding protein